MKKLSPKRGFTLIELLVVISIIAILVAVGVTSYGRATKLSRDAKRKTDLEQIRQALETFRSETTAYPTTGQGLAILQSSGYITTVPTDPKPTYSYRYTQNTSTTYTLCAALETTPTTSTCTSSTCGSGITCNYSVANP